VKRRNLGVQSSQFTMTRPYYRSRVVPDSYEFRVSGKIERHGSIYPVQKETENVVGNHRVPASIRSLLH